MARILTILPQITLPDLLSDVRRLDIPRLLQRTDHLVPYVPDARTTGEIQLVRALLEVPLSSDASLAKWFGPYTEVGVDHHWRTIVLRLRARGHEGASALAHEEAVGSGAYELVCDDDEARLVWAPLPEHVVRPRARTLGLSVSVGKGSWEQAAVPRVTAGPLLDSGIEALAEAVAKRIRPTIGGKQFLRPDRRGRALSVVASTVAAVLGHKAAWRWRGREQVARADVYRDILVALELEDLFEDARRVLEVDHPHHVPVAAPWPPGEGSLKPDIGILRYRSGLLQLLPEARLPVLPEGPGTASVEDEDELEDQDPGR